MCIHYLTCTAYLYLKTLYLPMNGVNHQSTCIYLAVTTTANYELKGFV
jgi:hypothetical protein